MENNVNDLQPPANWGVVARSRRIGDFKRTVLPTVVSLVPVVAAVLFIATGILRPLGQHNAEGLSALAIILSVPASLWALWNWSLAWNAAGDEAVARAEKAFAGWQDSVLLPFLEAKHGVRIRKGRAPWWTMDYFEVVHPERGTFYVRVSGIEFEDYYYPDVAFSDDISTPPVPRIAVEPSLVEVVHATRTVPKTVFRQLEVAPPAAKPATD